jgi:hypothetical protein
MRRWRIKNGSQFLLMCMVHVPALGSVIVALGVCLLSYTSGIERSGFAQVPYLLLMAPLYALIAVPFGILLTAIPGAVGGAALILLSHFRAPTTLELVGVAALVGGLPGLLLPGGWQGEYPYIFATVGAVSTLLLASRARKRGIVVPVDATAAAPSSAPA